MNLIYYTIGINQKSKFYDQDFDIAFDILLDHGQNSPVDYSPKFYGYDLSKSRLSIFKITLVDYDAKTGNHSRMGFAPLVEFQGDNIDPAKVLDAFLRAKNKEFDKFGNEFKTRKIIIDEKGIVRTEDSTSLESGTGGDGLLPFGFPGYAFPFGGVPSIIFLLLTGVSVVKLLDTNNPVWAGVGAYTFLHYLKNKKQ